MRRIASGTVDQYVYFQAATGLSSFTVYRARNGITPAAMTTPTVSEVDSTNMPGIYSLKLDEDMTVADGNITEHMAFYITAAGMTPKFVEVELFVTNVTHVNQVKVGGTGDESDFWNPTIGW